jgi:hypothetical protein
MPLAGFVHNIPANKRFQTYALDYRATGICEWNAGSVLPSDFTVVTAEALMLRM